MDFREHICQLASNVSPILEIGPSYNPILAKAKGYSVHTVDHATQKDLIDKYTAFGVDVSKIEPVDFVTTDIGSLCSYGIKYKIILASHVIEHTPDLVKFLNDCKALLDDDGVLILLIPDKRYCFDTYRPLTTTGDVLDAHLSARTRHRGAVFDHYAFFTLRNGAMAWGRGAEGEERQIHTAEQSVHAFKQTLSTDEYIDAHEWVFTPSSFELVIQDLHDCGMSAFSTQQHHDSIGYEFFTVLSLAPEPTKTARPLLLHAIRDEEMVASLDSMTIDEVRSLLHQVRPDLVSVLEADVHAMQKTNDDLCSRNETLRLDNVSLMARIAQLESSMGSVYESTSWKVTRPIRKAKSLFSSMLKRSRN